MRVKGLQVPWMNTELRQTMRDRDYNCYRKAVKTKKADDWKKCKELKSLVKCEMKRHKAEYYKELINQNKTKPDKRWKCINEVTCRKYKSTPTCITSDGLCHTDSQSISEILNTHFCTIGTTLANKLQSKYSVVSQTIGSSHEYAIHRNNFILNLHRLNRWQRQLKELNRNKAVGLDRISARLLKDASSVIAPSLANLFNRSLSQATFPSS